MEDTTALQGQGETQYVVRTMRSRMIGVCQTSRRYRLSSGVAPCNERIESQLRLGT
jgi:hypothetical protein